MNDIEIAAKAAAGDEICRKQINEQIHGIICAKTVKFCKTYCQNNRYQFVCTLPANAYPAPSSDAAYCEWGNGSYAWMLEDLTKSSRLLNFKAKQGASLRDYLNTIANSLAFRERWKDWRFHGKVNVPTCVKRIHDEASKIFFGLYNQKNCEEISQQLNKPLSEVQQIADEILIALTQEKKLYVLTPPSEVSLTGLNAPSDEDQEVQMNIPYHDPDAADSELRLMVSRAWKQLDPAEQFVLENLIVDEQDANAVLKALKAVGISVKEGIPAEDTDRQQLYYFRRKALKKLAELSGINDG